MSKSKRKPIIKVNFHDEFRYHDTYMFCIGNPSDKDCHVLSFLNDFDRKPISYKTEELSSKIKNHEIDPINTYLECVNHLKPMYNGTPSEYVEETYNNIVKAFPQIELKFYAGNSEITKYIPSKEVFVIWNIFLPKRFFRVRINEYYISSFSRNGKFSLSPDIYDSFAFDFRNLENPKRLHENSFKRIDTLIEILNSFDRPIDKNRCDCYPPQDEDVEIL